MKKITVHKPNELVTLDYYVVGSFLSPATLLFYNYILFKVQEENTNEIILNGNDVSKILGFEKNNRLLENFLYVLLDSNVVSKDSRGKIWGAFNLISSFHYEDGDFYIEIPNRIFIAMTQKEELYYTTIHLLEQKALKNHYAMIFYEIFKKYENINIPIFNLIDLKDLTGTLAKYKDYRDFKRYVLIKGLDELNKMDLIYTYDFEEIKEKRAVVKIKFMRTKKAQNDIPEARMSNNLIRIIKKVRKNKFIDSAYSQKAIDKLLLRYTESDIIKGLFELYKYNFEINNLSSILTAKIEDIKKSRMSIIEENQGNTLGQKDIETPLKTDIIEPKKSDLDIEKEKVSNSIRNSGLLTNKRLFLMGQLAEIDNLEELEKFKNNLKWLIFKSLRVIIRLQTINIQCSEGIVRKRARSEKLALF